MLRFDVLNGSHALHHLRGDMRLRNVPGATTTRDVVSENPAGFSVTMIRNSPSRQKGLAQQWHRQPKRYPEFVWDSKLGGDLLLSLGNLKVN
ncbi:hypothetical protein Halru_0900 [Halovivax ruber XH-70]|uniref:Uncharacterized protein n=1 Tax=Halovivax ruber (strain DSM 18193 / JCM 13892 / XH-70) TaxID=797302 RepID=L0IBA0_HALRX|nr:hypothetical protein Halru_0900 [Halovivax ruber XH-70]